jgi:predicted MPP superfamily phosphohydrolase
MLRVIVFLLLFFAQVGFLVGLDIYAYQAVRALAAPRWVRRLYWVFHGLVYAVNAGLYLLRPLGTSLPTPTVFAILTGFLLLYLPKLLMAALLLAEDLLRLLRRLARGLRSWLAVRRHWPEPARPPLARWRPVSWLALLAAVVLFGLMVDGVVRGRDNFTVRHVTLNLPNLPPAFDGLTITQISDLHVGSFANGAELAKGIDLAAAQKSDLVLMTGDLVNGKADELEGRLDILGRIRAPLGVYAVLGNHDFGTYNRWPRPEDQEANFQRILAAYPRLGWRLLRNEHVVLTRGDDRLALLGVDNWSRRFGPSHGDLEAACRGVDGVACRLLMSHDPSHWDAEIRPKHPEIVVTFSGHTHAGQFGIERPGFRWSPAEWFYVEWAGLYQEGSQYLYVNRGLGFIGLMGRVGIPPEITVFTLHRSK